MSALTLLGSMSVGEILPTSVSLLAGVLPDLQGRLAGAYALSGSITAELPTLQGKLDAAAALLAEVQVEVAIGGPTVAIDLQFMADIVAELEAEIAIVLELQVAFGSAGIYAYTYAGTAADFAGLVAGYALADAQPDDDVRALLLVTRSPAAWAALGKFLVQ